MRTKIRITQPGRQTARGMTFRVMRSVTLPNPVWQKHDTFARIQELDRRGLSRYGWEFLYPIGGLEVDADELHDFNTRFAAGRVEAWIRDGLKAEMDAEYAEELRERDRRTRYYGEYME